MDWHDFNMWLAHGLSGAAIVGTIVGLLPPFAAGIALIWYSIQIYESKTVQTFIRRRRERKIAALKRRLQDLQPPSLEG